MLLLHIIGYWFLMTAAFLLPDTSLPVREPIRWKVEKTSTLQVVGKTNVNEFRCDIPGYYQPDTLLCTAGTGAKGPVRLSGCLEVDVFRFDCHSQLITRDLRKTLKAEEHPRLIIRFLTLDACPAPGNTPQHLKGWVEVELAGVKKTFQIPYQLQKDGDQAIRLQGKRVFCFSDFKLVPPKKLGGIIRIDDEFTVDFRLRLVPVK